MNIAFGMTCPVCEGSEVAVIREAYDDRYGQPDLFFLVRCLHCKHVMTAPRLLESDLGALYSTYYPRKHVNVDDLKCEAARSVRPFARLRRWWAGTDNQGQYAVRVGELMMDIGCGSGLALLEARALGAKVSGVEADPNVRRIADELGLRIHIGSLLDEPFAGEQFDLVVLNQVIEHIPDPSLILSRLRSRVRPGGRIILVFPNIQSLWCHLSGDRWINWHIPYHLHHFSRKSFKRMAARSGYQVRSIRTITPSLWTILQIRASLIHVRQSEPSPIWSASNSCQTIVVKPIQNNSVSYVIGLLRNIVRFILLNRVMQSAVMLLVSIVNRVVDSLGFGDSLMIEITPVESP